MNISLSQNDLANTRRTRALVELAHAKSLSAASWKITHCQSANVSVKKLNSQIYKCQSTIADVILILLCKCPRNERDPDKLIKILLS